MQEMCSHVKILNVTYILMKNSQTEQIRGINCLLKINSYKADYRPKRLNCVYFFLKVSGNYIIISLKKNILIAK